MMHSYNHTRRTAPKTVCASDNASVYGYYHTRQCIVRWRRSRRAPYTVWRCTVVFVSFATAVADGAGPMYGLTFVALNMCCRMWVSFARTVLMNLCAFNNSSVAASDRREINSATTTDLLSTHFADTRTTRALWASSTDRPPAKPKRTNSSYSSCMCELLCSAED